MSYGRWGSAGDPSSPAGSSAVLRRFACYGGLACYSGLACYDGLARGSADRNVLSAHFGRLGYQDLQNAVVGCGFDRVGHHVAGQGDRPAERAVAALGPVDLLRSRIVGGVPLALDRQQAVLEGDLQVLDG